MGKIANEKFPPTKRSRKHSPSTYKSKKDLETRSRSGH